MKKLLTAAVVSLALAAPMQSAQAWWGPWGGWGPWSGFGDMWGGFDFHIGAGGWGRGYGYPYYGYPGWGYPGWGYPHWAGYPYLAYPVIAAPQLPKVPETSAES